MRQEQHCFRLTAGCYMRGTTLSKVPTDIPGQTVLGGEIRQQKELNIQQESEHPQLACITGQ